MFGGGITNHSQAKHDSSVGEVKIVTWTGNGTNPQSVPHGMTREPKFMLAQNHSVANLIFVFFNGDTGTRIVASSTTWYQGANCTADATNIYVNETEPNMNTNGHTYSAICVG